MRKRILTIAMILSASFAWAGTEVVSVRGMVCSFCAQGITKKFKEQPEVADVQVSLENKKVTLTYKEGQTLSHDKIESILKGAGYEVSFHE